MSAESTREYLARFGLDDKIITYDVPTATVQQAADASGLEPGQIGKTMAFDVKGTPVLVLCAGDAKVWNSAFKRQFGVKPTFISPDELEERVGHPMGGVCPFDVREERAELPGRLAPALTSCARGSSENGRGRDRDQLRGCELAGVGRRLQGAESSRGIRWRPIPPEGRVPLVPPPADAPMREVAGSYRLALPAHDLPGSVLQFW